MVTSTVVNLQCNYLSQTKSYGQKWQEMNMRGNSAQEMGSLEWHVHSILPLQGTMEWKSIPFCPCRAIWHVGKNGMLHRCVPPPADQNTPILITFFSEKSLRRTMMTSSKMSPPPVGNPESATDLQSTLVNWHPLLNWNNCPIE